MSVKSATLNPPYDAAPGTTPIVPTKTEDAIATSFSSAMPTTVALIQTSGLTQSTIFVVLRLSMKRGRTGDSMSIRTLCHRWNAKWSRTGPRCVLATDYVQFLIAPFESNPEGAES